MISAIGVFATVSFVATAEQSTETVNLSPSSKPATQQQSVRFAQSSTCYTRCMGQYHDEPRCFKKCGNHDD